MTERKIIHVDCDCFYAAVEMRDDPSLRDVPLAIGGEAGRGVVATCNYPARAFGVRSAMPGSVARRLCPDLVTVAPDMKRYRTASKQVMAILREMTDLVEPLSLDEAFLDVSEVTDHKGSATLMAQYLRKRVKEEVGITISAGIAPNKFLAKIASDWEKPDGLFVITPDKIDDFVQALQVEKLFGVGKVTAGKLHDLGVSTCGDLQVVPVEDLVNRFGKQGYRLREMAFGRDDREVVVSRLSKSLSVERTFSQDLTDKKTCDSVMEALVEELNHRLGRKSVGRPIHKLFIKIRYSDFSTHTLERVRSEIQRPEMADFQPLLDELVTDTKRPVRLLGLGVRFRNDETSITQLWLF
jgi:DNA polymerase-4